MIFKAKKGLQTGLVKVEDKEDVTVFKHLYNIEDAMARAYKLRQGDNNGFVDDKRGDHAIARHIGEIPPVFFAMHPEWNNEPELIKKWLRTDPIGKMFKACSGGI